MQEKIQTLREEIAEVDMLLSETIEQLSLTKSLSQKTQESDAQKMEKIQQLAHEKIKDLPENDPKRFDIEQKIALLRASHEKKSQEFLNEISELTEKIESYSNASSSLTKKMIDLYSE